MQIIELPMLRVLLFSIFWLTLRPAVASETLALWPKVVPEHEVQIATDGETSNISPRLVAGKPITRLGNVKNPSITIYKPDPAKDTGAAVVVCPGGGYGILAIDLEGTEVCQWLNSIGITGVLLKYRVPPRKGKEPYTAPLQDVQRALGLVRYHASQWKIDPHRMGIIGFSAGGDLAALASTRFEQRTYPPVDGADQASCRPDFALLIYPGRLVLKEGPKLAPELVVTTNTPPTFLIQTEDDPIHVENSLFYFLALKQAKVPAEMHIFTTGGHGYGLRESGMAVSHWPVEAEDWLRRLGVLKT
jgi:acetyl esterase/lipase